MRVRARGRCPLCLFVGCQTERASRSYSKRRPRPPAAGLTVSGGRCLFCLLGGMGPGRFSVSRYLPRFRPDGEGDGADLTLIRKYLALPPAESPTGARPQGRHPSSPREGRWNTFQLRDAEGESSCSALRLAWGFPVGRQLVCRRTPSAGDQLPPYAPLGARRGGTLSDVR